MTDASFSVERDDRTYRIELDPLETHPVTGMIAVFEETEQREAIDLPPLYDVVECEALGRLVADQQRRALTDTVHVECVTDRFRLTVDSTDDSVLVELRLPPE